MFIFNFRILLQKWEFQVSIHDHNKNTGFRCDLSNDGLSLRKQLETQKALLTLCPLMERIEEKELEVTHPNFVSQFPFHKLEFKVLQIRLFTQPHFRIISIIIPVSYDTRKKLIMAYVPPIEYEKHLTPYPQNWPPCNRMSTNWCLFCSISSASPTPVVLKQARKRSITA